MLLKRFFIRVFRNTVLILFIKRLSACFTFSSDTLSSETVKLNRKEDFFLSPWSENEQLIWTSMNQTGTFMISVHLKIICCVYLRHEDTDSVNSVLNTNLSSNLILQVNSPHLRFLCLHLYGYVSFLFSY